MNKWMLIAATIALAGCQAPVVDSDEEVLPADYESEGLSGAADNAQFVRIPKNEPLQAKYLKRMLCAQVAAAPDVSHSTGAQFVDNCLDHTFTVTEQVSSQKVIYRNFNGVTLGLSVKIESSNPQMTAFADMRRQFDDDFDLQWTAKVAVDRGDDDVYLLRLADEAGEYFWGYEDTDFVDHVHPIRLGDLPSSLEPILEREIEDIERGFNPGDSAGVDEAFRVEHPNGETAGHVVIIGFMIDHPLFDGGGTTLYINNDGVVLTSVDFWG